MWKVVIRLILGLSSCDLLIWAQVEDIHSWRRSCHFFFFVRQDREKGQHTAPFLWAVQVEKWKIWGRGTNPPALRPQALVSACEGVSYHSWPCGTNKEQHCVGAPPPSTTYLDVWLLVATQDNVNLRLNKLGSEASFEDTSLSFLHLSIT